MAPRFGAFLFTSLFDGLDEATVLSAALDYARIAEETGFDDLWVSEHHFIDYGITPSAIELAGFLLGRTTAMRVGTAVVLLPQHPEVFVAERAALLDHVSGGRFDLGVGRGGPSADLAVAGRGLEDWKAGVWPAVDRIREAWAGRAENPAVVGGTLTVRPRPRPGGDPPLLVAAVSDTSVDEAAARRLPMLMFLHESDEARRAKMARWSSVAVENGHDGADPGHACALVGHVTEPGEDVATVGDRLAEFLVSATSQYVLLPGAESSPAARLRGPDEVRTYVDTLLATHPIGTVEDCVARLSGVLADGGPQRVLLMLEAAAEPERVARNVAAFGTTVLPAVREKLAP
ncbi:LLM class flavin-dependent oxidoreductase [Pseudonocardia phyllosphaerae]|uniref:LLM class flavin-dependent oxidoreductase n=1 Tax=Pseudonocardia phyllosphaerae TaxID=3390502 RepID=UPI00397C8091